MDPHMAIRACGLDTLCLKKVDFEESPDGLVDNMRFPSPINKGHHDNLRFCLILKGED